MTDKTKFYANRLTEKLAVDRTDGASRRPPPATPARLSSRDLLGERGDLIIDHDGREYRLRLTQNGKLILTA
jgi:hemin uptake protein HemP